MRGLIVLLAALTLTATAQAKPDPQITALKRQVSALTVQVKALQKQAEYDRQLATCYYALNQDTFRTAFTALSKITQYITGSPVPAWEQIPRFDDQGSCAAVGFTRP